MAQQINLYRPVQQPVGLSDLSLKQAGYCLLALVGLLLAISAFDGWQLWQQQQRLEQVQQAKNQAQSKLQQVRQEYAPKVTDTELVTKVERLRGLRDNNKQLLASLEDIEGRAERGFYPFLRGLADQHRQGIWLQAIQLSDVGNQLQLAGFSLQPGEIPRWLEGLQQDTAFANFIFSSVEIGDIIQADDESLAAGGPAEAYVGFCLSTQARGEGN